MGEVDGEFLLAFLFVVLYDLFNVIVFNMSLSIISIGISMYYAFCCLLVAVFCID